MPQESSPSGTKTNGGPVKQTPDTQIGRSDGSDAISIVERLADLRVRVDDLESKIKKPFYKTGSFWIGITTIPVIFASGWLLQATANSPALLREIHRLLGTEPALVAALDEQQSALKAAVETLGKGRFPYLLTVLRMGLLRERAQQLICRPDPSDVTKIKLRCEVPQTAFANAADAPFTVGAATKADVSILVSVVENVFKDDGYWEKDIDRTSELESKQLIRVSINGKELALSEQSRWGVKFSNLSFAKYKFSCFSFGKPEVPEFPINVLTVNISGSADRRYAVTVGALVSESQEKCESSASK